MKEQSRRITTSEVKKVESSKVIPSHDNQHKLNETLRLLQTSVTRHEHFSSDIGDEFQIRRENGEVQGIFKVWASPIIPELENTDIETWSQSLRGRPLALFESLEQWRSFSDIADRRLQQIFSDRPLPSDPGSAMAELFLRLHLAFAFASPFYNLEALVADSREIKLDNPIDFSRLETARGKLDLVAMTLPSAIKNLLTADRLDWGNISWDLLKEQVTTLNQNFLEGSKELGSEQFKLLMRVAITAGIKPEEVLFAANALQFIPSNVGGKKEDLEQSESLAMLSQVFEESSVSTSTGNIAQEMNALIRFLNWTTSIQSPENFRGEFWKYDAVCATANTLLELIKKHPEVAFNREFARVFVDHLAPQLDNLDATSAKGRFLLQLVAEWKFKPTIPNTIAANIELFINDVMSQWEVIQTGEMMVDLAELHSPFLVGGKAIGIARAMQIFTEQMVQGGQTITSETIDNWLNQVEGFEPLIAALNSANTLDEKIRMGQEISQLVSGSEIPQTLLQELINQFGDIQKIVLRSSSFDEDVDIIGPAPGIYESVIGINPRNIHELQAGLKIVVSSFFSEKAIGFREMKGLRHFPIMAIIVQEFINAPGGSVFIEDGRISLDVVSNPSQINTVGNHFEKHELIDLNTHLATKSNLLSSEQMATVVWLAQKAEELFGPTDIEFVIDPETAGVKILQLRSLRRQISLREDIKTAPIEDTIIVDDLDFLPTLDGNFINLKIGEDIDLEKFQGQLFRWIIANNNKIVEITLNKEIPRTCHFANIVGCLGIKLTFVN